MATFLLVAYPLGGHIYPVLSLAKALKTKGHTVAFYCDPEFAEAIIDVGATFCEPIKWQGVNTKLPPTVLQNLDGDVDLSALIMQYKMLGSVTMMTEDIEHYAKKLATEVIISELFTPSGGLAAERLDIPWASVAATPLPVLDAHKAWLPDTVWPAFDNSEIRKNLNLPPNPGNLLWSVSPFLHILAVTTTFANIAEDLPSHFCFAGPLLLNSVTNPPEWVSELSNAPTPILITASSNVMTTSHTYADVDRYIRAAIDGLANKPLTVIITLPTNRNIAEFSPLPSNIKLETFVPHEALMPYLKAVITHGGWGIIGRSLTHGIPLVVVPFVGDQPTNAVYCEQQGVGITISPSEITPENLYTAVETLLNNPTYKAKSQMEAKEINCINPIKTAVEHLEGILKEI